MGSAFGSSIMRFVGAGVGQVEIARPRRRRSRSRSASRSGSPRKRRPSPIPCAAAICGSVSPVTAAVDSWFRLCANSTAASHPWFVGFPFASNVSSSSGAVSSRTRCSIWFAVRLPPFASSQAGISVPARPQSQCPPDQVLVLGQRQRLLVPEGWLVQRQTDAALAPDTVARAAVVRIEQRPALDRLRLEEVRLPLRPDRQVDRRVGGAAGHAEEHQHHDQEDLALRIQRIPPAVALATVGNRPRSD